MAEINDQAKPKEEGMDLSHMAYAPTLDNSSNTQLETVSGLSGWVMRHSFNLLNTRRKVQVAFIVLVAILLIAIASVLVSSRQASSPPPSRSPHPKAV